jgi:hypothetical protein
MVKFTDPNPVFQSTLERVTVFHKLLVVWENFFLLIMSKNLFI